MSNSAMEESALTKGKARDLGTACIGHAFVIGLWLCLYFVFGFKWPMAVFGGWWGLTSLSILWLSWPLIFFLVPAERQDAWSEAVFALLQIWIVIVPTVSTIIGSQG